MDRRIRPIAYGALGLLVLTVLAIAIARMAPGAEPAPTAALTLPVSPTATSAGQTAPPAPAPSPTPTLPDPTATSVVRRTEHYVSPVGSPGGDGSQEAPWDLQTALDQPDAVQPGDTIWLLDGVYRGNFMAHLQGAEGALITVRAAPGARPILDGDYKVLGVEDAHYARFWGLEITNSANTRAIIEKSGPGSGVFVEQSSRSTNIQFINLIVHDIAGQGFAFWKNAEDSEIYGCLVYGNGTNEFDHGIYTQNENGTKRILDNLIFNNASHGIHAYGSDQAFLNNFVVSGNTVFDNGAIGYDTDDGAYGVRARNILIGGSAVANNLVVTDNVSYLSNGSGDALNLGYRAGFDGAVVEDNYLMGGSIVFGGDYTGLQLSDNQMLALGLKGLSPLRYTDNDFLLLKPNGLKVFVRPNQYEPDRAHLTIFNWNEDDSVVIPAEELAALDLRPGDIVELRNAQDYLNDSVQLPFDGQALVVPMTGHSVFQPVGLSFQPPSTFPRFGAFVLFIRRP